MRQTTIARNYAETLLELARRADELEGWGRMIADVSGAVQGDETMRRFLETPRVSAADKNAILQEAFADRMPRLFVRFLQTLVKNRRQMLIPEIATEYWTLLDEVEGRVHAQVTVARAPDKETEKAIAKDLSRVLGKKVVPHITVNPAVLGGMVVRVGDEIMDGSVRRRLGQLRNQLLHGKPGRPGGRT
jgi:F-type H+-transporting ATPase subunit delta